MPTFIDRYRTGDATAGQIDDAIDQWHDGPDNGTPLHTFLGLTFAEYGRWVERNELPRYLNNDKACGAADGSRWGYLDCGCTHDGYGGHLR